MIARSVIFRSVLSIALLACAVRVDATTWASHKVTCPLCETENNFQAAERIRRAHFPPVLLEDAGAGQNARITTSRADVEILSAFTAARG
jgi:hypothetical protein